MSETVTFNGVSLATIKGLDVLMTDPHRPPARDLNTADLAQVDKSVLSSAFYKERKVHVFCTLGRDSKDDLQLGIMELEAILQSVNKLLVFSIAGVQSEFIATRSNISIAYNAGSMAELDIEFLCTNPTHYAVTATPLYSYSALVGSEYDFAVTWRGNVPQQPVIEITINSLIDGDAKTVTVGNETTGQILTILTDWTALDELVIDCKNKTVKLNDEDVNYTGKIPEFSGLEEVHYEDNFGARNIAVDIEYQQRNI